MVRWDDPAVEARLSIINTNINFLLLGIFTWEYCHTLDVEYAVIRGRLSLRWPLVPYLVGRITLLGTLSLITIVQTLAPTFLACQSGITSATVLGDITLASSSANLMIRTWLIWKNSCLVHAVLVLASLGHWTLLAFAISGAQTKAFKSSTGCIFHVTNMRFATAVFGYTMFYDSLVFALSVVGLSRQPSDSPLRKRLRSQGIVYFAVAVATNILPTVFGSLGSASLLAIVSCSATTISMIVSCRAVRSLLGLRAPSSKYKQSIGTGATLTTEISIGQYQQAASTNA